MPDITAAPPCTATPAASQSTDGHPLAGRIAAPSFVIPANVAQNAHFLSGKVDEVGLCLFEAQGCLDYGPADLPDALAALPLRWHAHLPVDLPWPTRLAAGNAHPAREAARLTLAVLDRIRTLVPHMTLQAAVLHPPEGSAAFQRHLLTDFAKHWHGQPQPAPPLLLENVAHSDVVCLGDAFLADHGMSLCLDVGHLLGYGQSALLHSALPSQAAMLHWSAPGNSDQHLPLTAFTPTQRCTALHLMADAPPAATHMVEIFNWDGLAASLPVLAALANESR
ncbi:MAG: cobamide remodeling phosphodiesterase CbiR [Desulfovibrio sp.]|uniref:cobamide remodeling phosphodiesterase CbiR n=1 Tax=Desulfovibrio sp. TaxID=885 RepID=UPI0039E286A3